MDAQVLHLHMHMCTHAYMRVCMNVYVSMYAVRKFVPRWTFIQVSVFFCSYYFVAAVVLLNVVVAVLLGQ